MSHWSISVPCISIPPLTVGFKLIPPSHGSPHPIPHLPHSPSPILSPLFSPRPGVYTVKLYIVFFYPISAVLWTWELHRTSSVPNALHEHSPRPLTPCISFPASLFNLSSHFIGIYSSSIFPLSLSFFRQTYSSIFSLFWPQVTPVFLRPFLVR